MNALIVNGCKTIRVVGSTIWSCTQDNCNGHNHYFQAL
jgi:hypothetical protein